MVNKCKIPSCKLSNDSVSLFSVPKNDELRKKWSEILNCALKKSSFVCEKHFNSYDIKSNFTSITDKGVIVFTVSDYFNLTYLLYTFGSIFNTFFKIYFYCIYIYL